MIFRSQVADIAIPDTPLTPFVLRRAQDLGDKPALIDGPSGRAITYRQLAGMVRLAAAGLAQRGFGKGDVMAIFSPNLPEYAVAFHAVATLGGLNTTTNSLYTADEVAFQLNDAGAKFLLTVPPFMGRAVEAAKKSRVQEIYVIGEAEGATPVASLLQNDGQLPEVPIDPREDIVALPYSSGTTGLPKGVMLTHRNLVANLAQIEAGMKDATADDVIIGVLPFFHIYGMMVIMNAALMKGATVVTMPRFDLEQFLQILQQYAVTRAYLVPPIVLALAKHPIVDKYDLSRLKVIFSGAAPLGEDVAQACADRLQVQIKQGYGMTETSPVTHALSDGEVNPGSIGRLIPNTECKIVDLATGATLGPNQDGEICVRGPQVMKGYLNNPEATAATIDPEGWLHTGDVGHIDDQGYYFVVDRVKELIKYKGYQVAPAELEAILLTHPRIADAAVIPSPDEESGEVPKAFVVLRSAVGTDEILSFVAHRVAPPKKVRLIEVVDEIPKSASGKILRRVLVERERAKTAR
ncbi:MAG TPA: 4-coumarate--CoA ligase family protein [Dehalococcoidia bacterium]|nr:4-coumarate--CoA ligase family protein [Dehalococcoidia bacterium]